MLAFYLLISFIVDCGIPVLGENVVIDLVSYSSTTTEDTVISFHCAKGFTPNHTITSVCTSEGKWNPDPTQYKCYSNVIANTGMCVKTHTPSSSFNFKCDSILLHDSDNLGFESIGTVTIIVVLGLLCLLLMIVLLSWMLTKKCSHHSKSTTVCTGELSQVPCPVYEDIEPHMLKNTCVYTETHKSTIDLNNNEAYVQFDDKDLKVNTA